MRQVGEGQPGLLSLPDWPHDLLSSGRPLPRLAFRHTHRRRPQEPVRIPAAGCGAALRFAGRELSGKSWKGGCQAGFVSFCSRFAYYAFKPGWGIGPRLGKGLILFLRTRQW